MCVIMKKYLAIKSIKGLNLQVVVNDDEQNLKYVDKNSEVPDELGNLEYTKIEMMGDTAKVYVYTEI